MFPRLQTDSHVTSWQLSAQCDREKSRDLAAKEVLLKTLHVGGSGFLGVLFFKCCNTFHEICLNKDFILWILDAVKAKLYPWPSNARTFRALIRLNAPPPPPLPGHIHPEYLTM